MCWNPLHQIDIDIAGDVEEPAWDAYGFLPDSQDNIEYDAGAVQRVRKMKKTAYRVLMALRVAVAAMLVAYNNGENITMHTIKLRVSHKGMHDHDGVHLSMLVSSDVLIVLIAGGDRDGQGKDLGVYTSTDQLQQT